MYTHKRLLVLLTILVMFLLGSCNLLAGTPPTPTTDPNLVYTQAVQTVVAELTQTAVFAMLTQVQPTATQPITVATATPAPPTATLQPTNTPIPPTATKPPIPCDRAAFVKDVTYPDGSELPPNTEFVKTWRLKNNGSCTWNSSYDLVFFDKNSMDGPAASQLTSGTVAPGETIDVSVTLTSPDKPGNYEGDWKLRNGSNVVFGIGEYAQNYFWVKITVINVVNYDFLVNAKDAAWENATDDVPFGDRNNDTDGIAAYLTNVKLEDGYTYTKVLATYPEKITDGLIKGTFSTYKVKDGDHFTAELGFRSDCSEGKVKYQLKYLEGGSEVLVKEWGKSCDGDLKSVDFDLSSLKGKEVKFILVVLADGSSKNDKAIWVDPLIENKNQ